MSAPKPLPVRTPFLAIAAAVFLVGAGVTGAFVTEREFREQKMEQAQAHARVLAASVSAALAFEDSLEAQQAVDALSSAPQIGAVAVYTTDDVLFAGRAGPEGPPAQHLPDRLPSGFARDVATAWEQVKQNDTELGWVTVSLSAGSGASRWMRYLGVGLLLVMASMLVGVIAAAHGRQERANQELARRANALAETNERLSAEVTERQKAQNALAQAQKMEAIGQLTGGIAHDFNNLLMVISSGLRLLEKHPDADRRSGIVNAMRQAVERGAGLTKQLLAFSRRQRLTPEAMLVQQRLEALRPLLEGSLRGDIVLHFDFRKEDAAVKVDPGQFDLAVLNLAVNARDAMPNGGSLTIGVADADGLVAVSLADTGVGMPPAVVERAFDPFFTTKEVGKGTGLGLSQVYGFAHQSGGDCKIESEPGRGTTVTITLPLTRERAEARERTVADEIRGAGTVLVVEDDQSVAAMVCEMLNDLGYTTTLATNAREALAKLADGAAADIVVTDIIMPGDMSGIDLARELKRTRPQLPVLLTTGFGGREDVEGLGFPVLRKPYTLEDLSAAMSRLNGH